jgi:hypothetical protein
MYQRIPGGTIVNIQGLDCCVPPEGYVFNRINKKLEFRGVYERSPIKEEQYWEVPALPYWYKEVMKAWDDYDKRKKEEDDDFYDARLEEFKQQEWDRRLNGYWYRNNGVATYLVGIHYLYLRWWHIDIGLPKFRIPDLEKAYFMQYCIEDSLSMGMVEVTKRRFGKSFWAGLFLTEYVTRTKMTFAGIQSKTGKDASKFFGKTVVNPFRRLPKFFRPEYDMSLGVNPKSEMRFQKTNIRGRKAESSVGKDELGGGIDHQPSDKVAYDGQKLHRYVADECGKTVEADIYERHEVVRYCLMDDEGKIIGKALYTTTVEKIDSDRDGVQDAFKLLWNESNQNSRKENGTTASGLYRFFMSAKRTRYFDKYGFPDEARTEREILSDREGVKHNTRSLFARIRKEPLTIEEAFSIDADSCIFNSFNIGARIKQLELSPVYKRSVWFYRDSNSQKVKWRDIQEKERQFHWKITEGLIEEESNQFSMEGSLKKPSRTHIGAIAVDGYSNSQGGQKWGSKASAWMGWREGNGHRKKVFGHLYGRPQEKDTLNEQVMLAAEYLGFQVFWEHVSDDYYQFFKRHGNLLYLGLYPKILIDPIKLEETERHRGVPTTPYSLTKQADLGMTYFENDWQDIDFEVLLDDAPTFDPNDRTKSDITVSFLIWNAVVSETVVKPAPPKDPLIQIYGQKNRRVTNPALAEY